MEAGLCIPLYLTWHVLYTLNHAPSRDSYREEPSTQCEFI